MNRSNIRRPVVQGIVLLLGVLFLLGCLFVVYLAVNFNRPPFPLEKLELVTTDMRTKDVEKLLSKPSSVHLYTNEDGKTCEVWTYSRRFAFPIVFIYFEEGKLKEHSYDQ